MTAKIKLNAASGGGSFSLQAPSSSANNRVFTLPDSADATLLTSTASLGKFASYAIIRDQKSDSNGGSFTNGAWRTRDLNTEVSDADNIVSISSNQFTLQAGSYLLKAYAPTYDVSRHQARLYNITDSSVTETGSNEFNGDAGISTSSFISARFTISGAKVFEIQHKCQYSKTTTGFGISMFDSFGSGNPDVYTTVEIFKES